MNKRKTIYTIFGTAIVLINVLHSFWYLDFTSLIWLTTFKFGLLIICAVEFLKEKTKFKIPIIAYRLIVLVSFILLLGIQKMNFGVMPFSGSYEVIEVCTTELITDQNFGQENRIERSEMTYGLYDSKEKTEVVYPLFLMFEWRFETSEITKYKSEYKYCQFLGIGEPY